MSRRPHSPSPDAEGNKTDPAFSKRSPDDYYLVSKDGLGFYFPGSILIDQSGFFRGLDTLGSAMDPFPRIELVLATSDGIRCGLQILRYVLRGMGTLPHYGSILDAILTFADAYDLPIIPRLLFHLYGTGKVHEWDKFLFAVLSGDRSGLGEMYAALACLPIRDMPDETRRCFVRWAPESWTKLNELHRRRLEALIDLEDLLCDPEQSELGEGWDERCENGIGCYMYRAYSGDWDKTIAVLGRQCWREAYKTDLVGGRPNLVEHVMEAMREKIACAQCRKRICEAWVGIVDNFEGEMPRWVEKD